MYAPPPRADDNIRGIDSPGAKRDSGGTNKPVINNTNNIGGKKAKFAEDIEKEPIIQKILDIFDGELLN